MGEQYEQFKEGQKALKLDARAKKLLAAKVTEYATLGHQYGCPPDQIENFIKAGVWLQPKQLEIAAKCRLCDLSDGPRDIMAGGGRGAAKQVKISETMLLWRVARDDNMTFMIKRADEVLTGDWLIGSNGTPVKVLSKSIPETRQFYKLTFDDGSCLETSDCHLWTVLDLSKRAKGSRERGTFKTTVETQWLASQPLKYRTQNRFAIPLLSGPVEPQNPTEPTLPPYTVGYWLGNGFLQGSSLHCHIQDAEEIAGYIAQDIGTDNVEIKRYKADGNGATILIRGWIETLKKANWPYLIYTTPSRKKRCDFVDDRMCIEWRNWSSKNRALLLSGLIDSDGTTKDAGVLEFDSTDLGLTQLVRNLLQSLGFKAQKIQVKPSKKENHSTIYRVTSCPDKQLFRLKRKQARLRTEGRQLREKRRYIVSIEKTSFEEGICFRVDSDDHLYVAGSEYILTHNTHAILAQVFCDDCQRIPNLKVLVLRKVGRANKEQIQDFRKKLLHLLPHKYREQQSTITFDNGSMVILGNFKDEKDIDKYLGLEYDIIHIVESNQLTLTKKMNILSCLRTNKVNWRPRCYEDTNPGGQGHFHNKQIFVEPYKAGKETETRYIHCTVDDNAFVDSGYKQYLEKLSGWQREAWLHGSWEFMAGAYFTNFRTDTHVFPNKIVNYQKDRMELFGCSFDYGFAHNTACLLFAKDRDGVTYLIDEYMENEKTPTDHSDGIKEMLARHHLVPTDLDSIVAGHDCFHRKEEGNTIAQTYAENGLEFIPAENARVNGWQRLLDCFGNPELGEPPTLFIHQRCQNTIEQIMMAQHHEKIPGDVAKFNCNSDGVGGDDCLDSLRIWMFSNLSNRIAFILPVNMGGYKPISLGFGSG